MTVPNVPSPIITDLPSEKAAQHEYLDSPRPDSPGMLRPDLYDATLPAWRAAIRRVIVRSVEKESRVIADMQVRPPCHMDVHRKFVLTRFTQAKVRTPWLDAYFVYTSSLGTHTFFMTVLPACFFFGYDEIGRGYVHRNSCNGVD